MCISEVMFLKSVFGVLYGGLLGTSVTSAAERLNTGCGGDTLVGLSVGEKDVVFLAKKV